MPLYCFIYKDEKGEIKKAIEHLGSLHELYNEYKQEHKIKILFTRIGKPFKKHELKRVRKYGRL